MFRLVLGMAVLKIASLSAADLSGLWAGTMEANGSPVRLFVTLNQRGPELSGSVAAGDAAKPFPIESPEVRGDELIFEARDNTNRLVRFHLKLEAGRLQGDAEAGGQVWRLALSRQPANGVGAAVRTWKYQPPSGVSPPVVLYQVPAEFPAAAPAADLPRSMILQVEIDPHGKLTNVRIPHSLGTGTDEKAIEAVKKWKFRPGSRDGVFVALPLTLEVNFQ